MSAMSLNTTTLGNLYKGLQPPANPGWNLDDGDTAYFVSQGSEYKIGKPSTQSATGIASSDLRNAAKAFGQAAAQVLAGSSDPNVVQKGKDIETWGDQVYDNSSVQQLSVTYRLTHVRNNQGDDTADVTLVYLYCDPISCPILMQASTSITWAAEAQTIDNLINAFGGAYSVANPPTLPDGTNITAMLLEIFELDTIATGMQVWMALYFALDAVDVIAGALIEFANDGGRVNFLAVIVHALQRVTVSVGPSAPSHDSYYALNTDAMPCGWIKTSKEPTISPMNSTPYEEGAFYGSYMATDWWNGSQVYYNDTNCYRIGMPELSWGVGGLSSLATTKVSYDGEDFYTVVFMLFGAKGELLAQTAVVQSGASSDCIVKPDPSWTLGSDPNALTSVIHFELESLGVMSGQVTTIQLQYMIPQLIGSCRDALRSQGGDALGGPQPVCGWSITWSGGYRYDDGSNPTLAIRSDGALMECHTAGDQLYWHTGTVDSHGDVIWSDGGGTNYQTGYCPTIAVQSDSSGHLLDIHNDFADGDLYWTYATLSSGKLDFENNGHKLFTGDHPAQHLDSSDGTVVFMYSVGSNTLNVSTAHFDGKTLSVNSNYKDHKYKSGDFPSLARHGSQIIEVHNDGSEIYWNVLPVGGDNTLSWPTGPWPMMMKGNQPHVANNSDQVVVVYDSGGDLYYAIGKVIDGQKIAWKLLNGVIGGGEVTAIATTPHGQYVMAYETPTPDIEPELHWRTGTVNAPS